jgi:hypothetical protein
VRRQAAHRLRLLVHGEHHCKLALRQVQSFTPLSRGDAADQAGDQSANLQGKPKIMSNLKKDTKTLIGGSIPASNGVSIDLEGIVGKAASKLSTADKARLEASLDETQDRTDIGNKLDGLVTTELRKISPGSGWTIHANRQVKTFPGMDTSTCARTIKEFVHNELRWYEDELRHMFVSTRSSKDRVIGNLRPDLIIQDPTMILTIWDLTSREATAHLCKTVLYAYVFSKGKYLCRIGETFWAGMKAD